MDLQLFYGKMRQEEQRIVEDFPIVVSHETASGGKAGLLTEVTKKVAAKLVVQGLARLATTDETQVFRDLQSEAKQAADALLDQAKASIAMLAMQGVGKLQAQLQSKETKE